MIELTEKTMPVAVWISSIGPAKQVCVGMDGMMYNKTAHVRATSFDGQFKLDFPTNPLGGEILEKFHRLLRYGFTVIDVPESWVNEYRRPAKWLDNLINSALERVMQHESSCSEEASPAMYDEALANTVLTVLAPKYPHPVNMVEIKSALKDNEPSDAELLTALQALQLEGLITGDAIRDHTSGKRKLLAMMKIHITKEGRQHLSGASAAQQQAVIHQYNNFGQSGAMGPNSVGTIKYQQQWETVQNQIDLHALADEIGRIVREQTPSTSDEYRSIALLLEAKEHAEKHEGSRFMEPSRRWDRVRCQSLQKRVQQV